MDKNTKASVSVLGQEVKLEVPIPVEQVYSDLAKPTVVNTGKTLSLLPRAINAALSPLEKWILQKEYSVEETKKILEIKLKAIEPEKIVSAESYIAIPAVQALSYCMDSELLREMFATLLANAMNMEYKSRMHPAFVEIIKQLSPLDVMMIKNGLYLSSRNPLLRIFACEDVGEDDVEMVEAGMPEFCTSELKSPVFSHYSESVCGIEQDAKARSVSIYNLNRLGLINTGYYEKIFHPEEYKVIYSELTNSQYYEKQRLFAADNNHHLRLTRGYTSPTEFGKLFYDLCCV